MLKHCQSLSSESRGGQLPQASSPPPLPPRFALCTDTISLSSSSSRSSSPAISDIVLETNFPAFAPCKQTSPRQRKVSKPFLGSGQVTSQSLLGGRSCSFLASNGRVEQDKDRGSPVLVQCRWFDSPPPPSRDRNEVSLPRRRQTGPDPSSLAPWVSCPVVVTNPGSEIILDQTLQSTLTIFPIQSQLERKQSKVRHSVHFGEEEDTNCESVQTEDQIKTKDEESNKLSNNEDKNKTCHTNNVPIIKVSVIAKGQKNYVIFHSSVWSII